MALITSDFAIKSCTRGLGQAGALAINRVSTTPFAGQKPGTSGLRQKVCQRSDLIRAAAVLRAMFLSLPHAACCMPVLIMLPLLLKP